VTPNVQRAVRSAVAAAWHVTLVVPTGYVAPDWGAQVAAIVAAPFLTVGDAKLTTTGPPVKEVATGTEGHVIDSGAVALVGVEHAVPSAARTASNSRRGLFMAWN
jgi:hypothetical protein